MLPLICAMIVAGLWLAKRYNLGALGARAGNARSVARLTETVVLSPGIRLAVVDFADKWLLLAVTKQGANLLSETDAPAFRMEEGGDARGTVLSVIPPKAGIHDNGLPGSPSAPTVLEHRFRRDADRH